MKQNQRTSSAVGRTFKTFDQLLLEQAKRDQRRPTKTEAKPASPKKLMTLVKYYQERRRV